MPYVCPDCGSPRLRSLETVPVHYHGEILLNDDGERYWEYSGEESSEPFWEGAEPDGLECADCLNGPFPIENAKEVTA